VPKGHYYLQRAVTPDQITQFAEGRGALKEEKALQGIFFFKANVTTRYKKTVVRKSRYC
jgi:hypothetical protein